MARLTIQQIIQRVAAAMKPGLDRAFDDKHKCIMEITEHHVALVERVDKLEKEIEARSWKGVYEGNYTYQKHNLCTHQGSIWIASEDPRGSPPGNGWELAVKRGRDGRDVR